MGPSGSGKSTLLHCLAGIYSPDQGEVSFNGRRLDTLSDAACSKLRRTEFGFVFQLGQLVPELTAADNIALPFLLGRTGRRAAYQQADVWLGRLGLDGIGGFLLLRPALSDYAIIGAKYFPYTVTPTAWGYIGVLVCVPLLSALAAVLALRRVRISPLGVSRRVTPPPPSIWRIMPLVLRIALFAVGLALTTKQSIGDHYLTPFAPTADPRRRNETSVGPVEIATAEHDIACKTKVNLLGVEVAVVSNYQNMDIMADISALVQAKAQVESAQAGITKLMAQYSG